MWPKHTVELVCQCFQVMSCQLKSTINQYMAILDMIILGRKRIVNSQYINQVTEKAVQSNIQYYKATEVNYTQPPLDGQRAPLTIIYFSRIIMQLHGVTT